MFLLEKVQELSNISQPLFVKIDGETWQGLIPTEQIGWLCVTEAPKIQSARSSLGASAQLNRPVLHVRVQIV